MRVQDTAEKINMHLKCSLSTKHSIGDHKSNNATEVGDVTVSDSKELAAVSDREPLNITDRTCRKSPPSETTFLPNGLGHFVLPKRTNRPGISTTNRPPRGRFRRAARPSYYGGGGGYRPMRRSFRRRSWYYPY
ncbi:hypothetical protein AVEN_97897-1 [Araneus ventricosus]|uniref:Uncharacterized protein n=1 Tax=Araneus ventricosus TaxID=182803 RepID=A0A4Y2NJ44_ARAVE|nr:hypothetical protein AVEN_97897-1 [Araneus ventricosus]